MKKLFVLFFAFILLGMTACSAKVPDENPKADEESKTHFENIYVDIGVDEDGYYGLRADVDLEYLDDEIVSIYVDDPVLLAFCVSSTYDNGIYLLKKTDAEELLKTLTEVRNALIATKDTELSAKLDTVINHISNSGPFTSAST